MYTMVPWTISFGDTIQLKALWLAQGGIVLWGDYTHGSSIRQTGGSFQWTHPSTGLVLPLLAKEKASLVGQAQHARVPEKSQYFVGFPTSHGSPNSSVDLLEVSVQPLVGAGPGTALGSGSWITVANTIV